MRGGQEEPGGRVRTGVARQRVRIGPGCAGRERARPYPLASRSMQIPGSVLVSVVVSVSIYWDRLVRVVTDDTEATVAMRFRRAFMKDVWHSIAHNSRW